MSRSPVDTIQIALDLLESGLISTSQEFFDIISKRGMTKEEIEKLQHNKDFNNKMQEIIDEKD